jgi:RNA polymerase sigma-70 factor (ECF subfamily)
MDSRLASVHTPTQRPAGDPLALLLPRVAQGDEGALQALYEATCTRVFGLALRILRDRASAEEAVVDVFAQVWRQAGRFDPEKGSIASWITTLARTRSIDLARIQRRRTRRETEVLPELCDELCDPTGGPVEAAADDERALRVRAALGRLPREQRQALELAFFAGLSHSEVAGALSAPLGTVKTRIRTGLCNLRAALAGVEGELR